jgi:hypothetical protein
LAAERSQRDATLDLLRGYFLAVMIVDHLLSFPSLFEVFTGRGRMWASAAEGFFAVSGFLVGSVRGSEARAGRSREATAKLLRRAGQLYVWSVGATSAYLLVGRFLAWPLVSAALGQSGPLMMMAKVLSLQYTYERLDMLPLYILFLALAPLALALLSAGRGAFVVALSLAVWISGLLMPAPIRLTGSYFSDASWQVLFFLALVLGYHSPELREGLQRTTAQARRWLLIALGTPSVGLGYLSWLDRYCHALWRQQVPLLRFLFDKVRVGPGRLMVASLWLVFLYVAVKTFESPVLATVGPFFERLGRNSLYVYLVQSVLVSPRLNPYAHNFWRATTTDMLVLLVVWAMVRWRVLFGVIPR